MRNSQGELRSVYAVIDKDRASASAGEQLDVDLFLISTGVEKVALNFGKPDQVDLDQMTVAEARRYMAEGHFAPGSMKPKIEACVRFLEQSSKPTAAALITNPLNLGRRCTGKRGRASCGDTRADMRRQLSKAGPDDRGVSGPAP